MSIQFKRSAAPGVAPTTAHLKEGELAINLYNKKLYTLDQNKKIINIGFSQDYADAAYLKLTGGVMKGRLQLYSGSLPVTGTDGLDDVVSRRYVDMQFGTGDLQVRRNADLDDRYLQLIGGTLTGALKVNNDTSGTDARITFSADVSQYKYLLFDTNNIHRWALASNSTIESGTNAGSDFEIIRFSDTGAKIETALTIDRSSGISTFAKSVNVPVVVYDDNTQTVITSAHVQRNKGSRKAAIFLTDATTLDYSSMGAIIELKNTDTSAYTVTLPSANSTHTVNSVIDFKFNGAEIVVFNNSTVLNKLYCAGSLFSGPTGNATHTLTLKALTAYTITSDGINWIVVSENRNDAWWSSMYPLLNSDPVFVGGVTSTNFDNGGANFRAITGEYGAFIRNDGTHVYFLQTAAGSQTGTYNSYRPLAWNLSTGSVSINADGLGTTTVGGNLAVVKSMSVTGTSTFTGDVTSSGTIYGTGIRAAKGTPGTDTDYNGFAFGADGDTGMFATTGTSISGSDLIFKNDSVTMMTLRNSDDTTIFNKRPIFGTSTPWDTANFNPANYAALASSPIFNGGITSTAFDAQGSNFRMVTGHYSTILRNDGADFYILQTVKDDQYGKWKDPTRPFSFNFADNVTFLNRDGSGTVVINAPTTINSKLTVTGSIRAKSTSTTTGSNDTRSDGYAFEDNGDSGMFYENESTTYAGGDLVFRNDGVNAMHIARGDQSVRLNVNTYYKGKLLETLLTSSGTVALTYGWNDWGNSTNYYPTSSGVMYIISGHNTTVAAYVNGTQVLRTDARDKYGQGSCSFSVPFSKGDTLYVTGAQNIRTRYNI